MKKRVLIFIVSYNAENFIESVLARIPANVCQHPDYEVEILIIDDASTDQTFFRAHEYNLHHPGLNITVLFNPKNQGYGGNQKIGYYYAICEGFDAVVLLHGDGQYAPEFLEQMIMPILDNEADVVLGSRMVHRFEALKGKMPVYKWLGNQVLTFLQNRILGTNLTEFHTGYRAYRVAALASVPFMYNSDYFDFDTDILIQMLHTEKRFREVEIPTFYGQEISRVNGVLYAAKIIRTSINSRIRKWGVFYHPKFDYITANEQYQPKFGFPSSHQFAIQRVPRGATVIDFGCGPGFMARELARLNVRVISVDRVINDEVRLNSWKAIETDLENFDFDVECTPVDTILALDIIEHLRFPEEFLEKLRERYSGEAPALIITTGNIGFLPIRLMMLLGQFNYGKRGILDLDHVRLFTFASLRQVLERCGYEILEERGIPAPFPLALGDQWLARLLLRINTLFLNLSKGVFSYQIAMVARPRPTLKQLLLDAQRACQEKLDPTLFYLETEAHIQ